MYAARTLPRRLLIAAWALTKHKITRHIHGMRALLLMCFFLSACASYGTANNPQLNAHQPYDEKLSCAEVQAEIDAVNEILIGQKSMLDDPIVRQVGKQTISTAGSQAAASAGVGHAGPFIGIFVNALAGMADRQSSTPPEEVISKADARIDVLYALQSKKDCD